MKYDFSDIVETDPPKKNRGVLSHLNPKNWGVSDYSKEKNFSSAFKKATDNKDDEFMYGDTRYATKKHPLYDASSSPNFNSAFKSARDKKEQQFKYGGKVFTTELVSKSVSDNYKNSKDFLEKYLQNTKLSLSKEDSASVDLWGDKMPYMFERKQHLGKEASLSELKKPSYTSITEQKGDLKSDGFYRSHENKVFVYSKPDDPALFTTSIHELTHKSGLLTNEPVVKNKNNAQYLEKDEYLTDPYERGARHMSTMYYLNSKGHQFDKFTDKEYEMLRAAEEDLPYDIYQLMELYGDRKEFIRQMNIPLGHKEYDEFSVNNVVDFSDLIGKEYNFDDILD